MLLQKLKKANNKFFKDCICYFSTFTASAQNQITNETRLNWSFFHFLHSFFHFFFIFIKTFRVPREEENSCQNFSLKCEINVGHPSANLVAFFAQNQKKLLVNFVWEKRESKLLTKF